MVLVKRLGLGRRDLQSGSVGTNKGAVDPLVPPPSFYDLGKGLGVSTQIYTIFVKRAQLPHPSVTQVKRNMI